MRATISGHQINAATNTMENKMRHIKQNPKSMTVYQRYTREELEKLGNKSLTVDGYQDLLDVNKLIKRTSKAQLQELANKKIPQYGHQDTDTLRDTMIKAKQMVKEFHQLPAYMRAHFKNDEFKFQEWLEENKDNKYAFTELTGELTKNPEYKKYVQDLKNKEEYLKNKELEKQESLAQAIAKAITQEPLPEQKK